MRNQDRVIVGIAGGSGAGKTWLSARLAAAFPGQATRISLDDFYRDRSHLSPARRRGVNYDHPRAIEWELLEQVLRDFRAGQITRVPHYGFADHCRGAAALECAPAPLLLVEGLWLLSRKEIRSQFHLGIYIDCPSNVRLARRLARDVAERGRAPEDVLRQFESVTAPMHEIHVAPQRKLATLVLRDPVSQMDIEGVVARVRELLNRPRSEAEPRIWKKDIEWRVVA